LAHKIAETAILLIDLVVCYQHVTRIQFQKHLKLLFLIISWLCLFLVRIADAENFLALPSLSTIETDKKIFWKIKAKSAVPL